MKSSLLPIIVLGFPLLELVSLALAAELLGWWLLAYLAGVTVIGVWLIRRGMARLPGPAFQPGEHLMNSGWSLMVASKEMAAGVLLVIPGLFTDIAAGLLLLLGPAHPTGPAAGPGPTAAPPRTIDGDYRRED